MAPDNADYRKRQENLQFELALLGLLAGLWGSSYLLIKIAVATIPPLTLIAMRVSLAAVFLLIVMWYQGVRFPKDWYTWRMFLIQAFFNSIASWTVLAWGQQYVDRGLAGVLNSTSPIFVLFITLLFTRHEAVTAWKLAGAMLGVVGVVMVVGLDALHGTGQQIAGQFAILLSAFLYACAAIYGRRFSLISPTVRATGTMIWATVCLGPLSLAVDRPWTLNPSASSIVAAIFLGLFGTGVALLLYFRLVRTIGSMGVASQSYLRAGVSVLLGIFILGEQFTQAIGFGLVTIILGVAVINIPSPTSSVKR
ncbi:MAG: EamA family transporter [Betaproteobacteria bacterium]|nr:EamA family transporter [Betaproteobacteria bacterium]